MARGNLVLLATVWNAPGRPAWWVGEARWSPPPDPAAKAQALSHGLADLPADLKAVICAWLLERWQRYLADQRNAAEEKMRSCLPSSDDHGSGILEVHGA